MDCRDVDKLIDAWLDGELDAGRAAELQQHIDSCDRCTNVHASLMNLLTAAPQLEPPADLHDRIMAAVGRHAEGGISTRHARHRLRFNWFLPTAAAACLMFFAAGWWASQWSRPSQQPVAHQTDDDHNGTQTSEPLIISPWLAMSWARAASCPSPTAPMVFMSEAVATELIATTAREDVSVDWCPPPSLPPLPAEEQPRMPELPVFVLQPAIGV